MRCVSLGDNSIILQYRALCDKSMKLCSLILIMNSIRGILKIDSILNLPKLPPSKAMRFADSFGICTVYLGFRGQRIKILSNIEHVKEYKIITYSRWLQKVSFVISRTLSMDCQKLTYSMMRVSNNNKQEVHGTKWSQE